MWFVWAAAGSVVEPHRIVAETVIASLPAMKRQGFKKLIASPDEFMH